MFSRLKTTIYRQWDRQATLLLNAIDSVVQRAGPGLVFVLIDAAERDPGLAAGAEPLPGLAGQIRYPRPIGKPVIKIVRHSLRESPALAEGDLRGSRLSSR